jgi:hypothetical protein
MGNALRWSALFSLVVASGCSIELAATFCADGSVCPEGWACPTAPGGTCVDPNPEFCAGQADSTQCTPADGGSGVCAEGLCVPSCTRAPDGTPCTTVGDGDGTCEGSLCVPDACNDGIVEGSEVCDVAPDQSCVDLGFDFGQSRCKLDCSGSEPVSCGYIGWRGLGIDGVINATLAFGDETWVATPFGIYRQAATGATWEQLDAQEWQFLVGTNAADVWAFSSQREEYARCVNGVCSTATRPAGYLYFAGMDTDGPIIGGSDATAVFEPWITVWTTSGWIDRSPPLDAFATRATAHGVIDGVPYVAVSSTYLSCGIEGCSSGTGTALRRWNGATWDAAGLAVPLEVQSFAGIALDDFVASGRYFHPLNGQVSPATVHISTVTQFLTRGAGIDFGGSVAVIPGTSDFLIVASDNTTHVYRPPSRGGLHLQIEPVGASDSISTSGDRLVVATAAGLRELGSSAWSDRTEATDGSLVRPNDISITADGGALAVVPFTQPGGALDGRSWTVDLLGKQPTAMQKSTSVPTELANFGLIDTWATTSASGSQYAISSTKLYVTPANPTQQPAQLAVLPLPSIQPTDLAGHGATSLLVVGRAGVRSHYWDGTWIAVDDSALPSGELNAVTALPGTEFLAVGSKGLVARLDVAVSPLRWEVVATASTANLASVVALDRDTFVAAGEREVLLCAATGCQVLTLPPGPGILTGASMRAVDDVMIVGSAGTYWFDGARLTPVDVGGRAPTMVVHASPTIWFGGGSLDRMVDLRSWKLPSP